MITVEHASDTATVIYIPRRVLVVRENAGDIEVVRASASYVFRRKTDHPDFGAIREQLEGRCYTVDGYGIEDDERFWFGRRYNWVILLYPGCPNENHFCASSPVPLEHSLGME